MTTPRSGDHQRPVTLEVTTVRSTDAVRLRLAGELDIATAPGLIDALGAIDVAGPPAVVRLDLGGVTFLDAAGLGALVRVRTLVGGLGATLILTDVPPRIRALLDLTQLSGTFPTD